MDRTDTVQSSQQGYQLTGKGNMFLQLLEKLVLIFFYLFLRFGNEYSKIDEKLGENITSDSCHCLLHCLFGNQFTRWRSSNLGRPI